MSLAAFTIGLLLMNGAVGAVASATTKVLAIASFGIVAGTVYGLALVAGWA